MCPAKYQPSGFWRRFDDLNKRPWNIGANPAHIRFEQATSPSPDQTSFRKMRRCGRIDRYHAARRQSAAPRRDSQPALSRLSGRNDNCFQKNPGRFAQLLAHQCPKSGCAAHESQWCRHRLQMLAQQSNRFLWLCELERAERELTE